MNVDFFGVVTEIMIAMQIVKEFIARLYMAGSSFEAGCSLMELTSDDFAWNLGCELGISDNWPLS